jgi:hypothetical protein
MTQVGLHEAKVKLSQHVTREQAGEVVEEYRGQPRRPRPTVQAGSTTGGNSRAARGSAAYCRACRASPSFGAGRGEASQVSVLWCDCPHAHLIGYNPCAGSVDDVAVVFNF